MGQSVRKKKGRPPKADSAGRHTPPTARNLRRSLRRRNVKYGFELDDYFDDEDLFDIDDDEDHRRKAKKLKLLLNLQKATGEPESPTQLRNCSRRVADNFSPFQKNGGKPSNIPKFKYDIFDPNCDANYGHNQGNGAEDREEKLEPIAKWWRSGMHTEAPSGLPLPDKKTLELILNKLQKKDIYGVYAEPVDPEELPDYHDVIKHPMDFATVRKKLQNGLYETMEQFEHDVFLMCSNALQYNEPDTIYHKQAQSIKELAVKEFHKTRLEAESSRKVAKVDKKMRPFNGDVLVEGNFLLNDSIDEGEMQTGKGPHSRVFGTESFVQDEDRRATFNTSLAYLIDCSEPMFSILEGESKHLVPVGLYSEHAYARSLARFAATLGSVVWKFASKRIKHVLPQGIKFGRGWVGEPESLPTPVFVLQNYIVKEPPFFAKEQPAADHINFENVSMVTFSSWEGQRLVPKAIYPSAPSIIASLANDGTTRERVSENVSPFLSPSIKPSGYSNCSKQHQTLSCRNSVEPHKKIFKQFEMASPCIFYEPHEQGQVPANPGQWTSVLAERGRNQQISLNQSVADAAHQVLSSPSSTNSNDSNFSASYAARSCMSAGTGKFEPAGSNTMRFNNPIYPNSACNIKHDFQPREFSSFGGTHVQPNSFNPPCHAFVPQGLVPVRVGIEAQYHNQSAFYPHLSSSDMTRFPQQATWWNLRPNLTIDFQSSMSPGTGMLSSDVLQDPTLQLRQFI